MNPETTIAILAFVAFAIPIISALWKLFNIREILSNQITRNEHRIELLEQKTEHLLDQQLLAINGLKEVVSHVRTRTQNDTARLSARLDDVENFLEKSTDFSKRQH